VQKECTDLLEEETEDDRWSVVDMRGRKGSTNCPLLGNVMMMMVVVGLRSQ
jgi:hypothetical protein